MPFPLWPALLACVLALAAPLAHGAGDAALPQRAQLHAFFGAGKATLDAFCAARGDCLPARRKAALFELFFRGSFAGPDDRQAGELTAQPDADAAYARDAADYFTDPGFACRRPLTARVLERLWQVPAAGRACPPTVPFMVGSEAGKHEVRHIDPARVSAVHLLFAGESGRTMSAFGHTGLRLVVCAPQRDKVDARCDEDLFEHLALGFRAAVDELDISLWKGLAGGYAVRLFADPFMRTYDEYTIQEFRALSSLPLVLDAPTRELLVRALAEVHWAYRNDYRFLTVNCASELSWLLRVVGMVAGEGEPWLDGANVRPDRLFARARSSPAFRGDALRDLAQAEREGFYFPGSAPYYQLALDTVAARVPVAPVARFDAFRALGAGARRRDLYEPALAADDAQRPRAAHAALVLEAWHEKRLRRELTASIARHYHDLAALMLAGGGAFSEPERRAVAGCIAALRQTDQLGYSAHGIPRVEPAPAVSCDVTSPEVQGAMQKLFKSSLPSQRDLRKLAELQATVDTVNWLAPQTRLPAFQQVTVNEPK